MLGTNGNCDVLFPPQIQQRNLISNEDQIQQPIEIVFDRLADLIQEELMAEEDQNQQSIEIDFNSFLINEEVMSIFDIMFWRGVSNPQSGETSNYNTIQILKLFTYSNINWKTY